MGDGESQRRASLGDSDAIQAEYEYDSAYVRRAMRDSRPWWMMLFPAGLMIVAGVIVFFALGGRSSLPDLGEVDDRSEIGSNTLGTTAADAGAATGQAGDGATDAGATDGDDGEENPAGPEAEADADGTSAGLPLPADGPYVDATLTDNVFVLSGVVPDEDTKQAIEQQAQVAYAPFYNSTLEVDETVGSADWLAGAPNAVGLIPMITDGTIRIQDGEVTLVGRAPSDRWKSLFEQAIATVTGLPVTSEDIAITDLNPPTVIMKVDEGVVTLDGVLPSEQVEQAFLASAGAVYGAEQVTSSMEVDSEIYTSFWMYTLPGIFQLLAPFDNYEVKVDDGVVTGSAQGGLVFEANSFTVPPEGAGAMSVAVAMMARDRALNMTMIGHTDSSGPDDVNQRLSVERAQAVVQFFIESGIDDSRLKAEGRGSSEPIAPNDTSEGRAKNRRVEFSFGYDPVAG